MSGRLSLDGRTGEAFRQAFTTVMVASGVCAALAGLVSLLTISRERSGG
jgi:hypothetical protein